MKRFVKVFFALGLLLALATTVWAAAVSIDTFNDGDQVVLQTTLGTTSDYATGSMIGGERDLEVENVNGVNFVIVTVNNNNDGRFSFSLNSGATGKARIQWDGNDSSMTLNTTPGLNDTDLTDTGNNDAIALRMIETQGDTQITFLFHDGTNQSSIVKSLPPDVAFGQTVDVVYRFSEFTGVDFTSINAIEMLVDGTLAPSADITIDLFESTVGRDYGDLPDTYKTTKSSDGARHAPDGLRLGENVEIENDGPVTGDGTNDDITGVDDEDGVVRTPGVNWSAGANGGSIDVTVNGCGSGNTCYLSGWIDWDQSGAFDASGEKILDDQAVSDGTQTITFNIPTGTTFNTSFNARFRLCRNTGECNTFSGEAPNGEVEDYQWAFGPTAVTLETFGGTATGTDARLLLAGALAGLFTLTGGWLVWRRR